MMVNRYLRSRAAKLLFLVVLLAVLPAVQAQPDLQVVSFSCSPDEVEINKQFSCTATVENKGDALGVLNTATLYPDAANWLENPSYAETVNVNVDKMASTEVTFSGLKGKKSGDNGFSKIVLDEVTDTYVSDNGINVNVIDVVAIASSAGSSASGASVDVTGQVVVGGSVDVTLTFSVTSGGCSIGSQAASATTTGMSDGQTTSHTWLVTLGSADCVYSVSAKATSNPSGTASKTDSSSGTITCSDCVSGDVSGGGGGGGGGGAVTTEEAVSETKTWATISPRTENVMKIYAANIGLDEIIFGVTETLFNVEVTVSKLVGKPAELAKAAAPAVYRYIDITKKALTDSQLKTATLKFHVEKSWLSGQGGTAGDVRLYRYTSTWEELATTRLPAEDDDTYHYFEAAAPGLSYFAIGLKEAEELPEEPEEPPAELITGEVIAPPIVPPEELKTPFQTIIFTIVVATVLATAGIGHIFRERLAIGAKIEDLLEWLRRSRQERMKGRRK